jgi:tetrapyrrole methylase family protein / MazG family protein
MSEQIDRLIEIIAKLRGPGGCPWDREQTFKSILSCMLDEAYEYFEAVEENDTRMMREELGDLLFHIVFICQICSEKGFFDIREVVASTCEKMRNRHPHIFAREASDKPIEARWEEIKRSEKEDYSLLAAVPHILPALLRAYVVSKRASRVGFDWEKVEDIFGKLDEEIQELKEAEKSGDKQDVEEEIGDLLFTAANIARFYGIDPETALRGTVDKFVRRFSYIEKHLDVAKSSQCDMEALWNEVKNKEKEGG